eukprot:3137074-Lingulodinium_polyedra.AAC.1
MQSLAGQHARPGLLTYQQPAEPHAQLATLVAGIVDPRCALRRRSSEDAAQPHLARCRARARNRLARRRQAGEP